MTKSLFINSGYFYFHNNPVGKVILKDKPDYIWDGKILTENELAVKNIAEGFVYYYD